MPKRNLDLFERPYGLRLPICVNPLNCSECVCVWFANELSNRLEAIKIKNELARLPEGFCTVLSFTFYIICECINYRNGEIDLNKLVYILYN